MMPTNDDPRETPRWAATREGQWCTRQVVKSLREFTRAIALDGEPDAQFDAILTTFLRCLQPADCGALLLYGSEEERLMAQCTHGYDTDAMQGLRLSVGESMAGLAFQSGQAALYAQPLEVAAAMDATSPENLACFATAMAGLTQPSSVICAPVTRGAAKLGVLVAENWRQEGTFSAADLELAQLLAELAAVGIECARLDHEGRSTRAALEQSTGFQGYVRSALSHEMRTPLASIKGYATALLLDEVAWDAETQREYLNVIVEESDKLTEIISDLLESAIIDAGLLKIERQPTRLARLVQEVADDVSRRTDQHQFLLSFAPTIPILDLDSSRIRRLLFNLLDNAVKYSPGGGLIVVRGEAVGDECVVSVADQGVGIAPQNLNRLFERFFRVKAAAGKHVVGSGLGLPIARSIVEAHGGRIWAESKVGQGSCFYFTLPLGGTSSTPDPNGEGR